MLKENYKMIELLKIIYEANRLGIWLWLEGDKLRFKYPEHTDVSEMLIKLKQYKNEIIVLLKQNKVFNSTSLPTQIYRIDTDRSVLSFAQERLWFIEQYEEGTNAYHIPEVYELNVDTDIAGIKYALRQVVNRHEVLRSTIKQGDDQENGIQVVHNDLLPIEEIKISNAEDHKTLIKEDINRPFDLSKEYPIRVKFYAIESTPENSSVKTLLLINMHHIASEGWSNEIFHKELSLYYEAHIKNDIHFNLPELEVQYKDYAIWQRTYLTGVVLGDQLSYWKEKLSGYQSLELPMDYARPNRINYSGAHQEFTITGKVSSKLRALARNSNVTLHSVMLSTMNILLSKYTGQDDILIGSLIANRHHRQTEKLIGFFVNTQVNRTLLNNTQSFENLIVQVHQQQVEAQLHQDLPFEKLVEELGVERDASRHPVFQVLFGVQSFGNQNRSIVEQKKYFKPYQIEDVHEVEKFDLSIFINDSEEELTGYISYAASLFHKNTIARFIHHYQHLLDELTQTPDKPYSQISLLSAKEYNTIMYDWNATDKAYSRNKTIHELFEEQVKKTPGATALIYEEQKLTYRELNEKSNQLASYIRTQYKQRTGQPLSPDTLIALCVDRSLEMIIGILAVLKAGGAYVPMDPAYSQERIDYLLEDTKTEFVLTQKHITGSGKVKLPQEKVIYIELTEALYVNQPTSNLLRYSKSNDLAYVIYTSGTTGKPKGAMLNHSGIVNRLEWMQAMYPLKAEDVVLQKTPYVFDVSVWEILWANWYGAKIVLAKPDGHKDSEYLCQLIQRSNITTLHFVPSMLEAYNHYLLEQGVKFNSTVRQLFCSGEALTKNVVQQTYQNSASHSLKLHNLYGPTEASVDVTFFETGADKNVHIGRPIQNTQVYILDRINNPVPVGVIGELYLGGTGLARGYLNRLELTAERFVPNPFATEEDKVKGYTRLYKTGDLVRWLPDGNIEYIGRNDDQVKIRGYRIELGEIENALLQVQGIKQSCVLAKERKNGTDSNKYLVAYYVLDNRNDALSQTMILDKLSQLLPEYMVPGMLVQMETLPLTINGKLDKKALIDPDLNFSLGEYVAPTSEIETVICKIWQEVLGISRVGITDNFFRIGGNSLLAIRVAHRMNKSLKCDVKVADVFRLKTIQQLLITVQQAQELKIVKPHHYTYNCDLADLMFIHPGGGGCEVYQKLADLLAAKFNCIGIDNYNIYSEDKISSANKLANVYLSAIEQERILTIPVNLLGWSLGGTIAMEMAAILEMKGFENINVILLDTQVLDEISINFKKQIDIEQVYIKHFRSLALGNGAEVEYIEKIISCMAAESELERSTPSCQLKHTQIILFKANQADTRIKNETSKLLQKHFTALGSNNVELFADKVKVINLDCQHGNILEKYEVISNYILAEEINALKTNAFIIEAQ
jgi:amino acid adenylation domain-containing protein